MHEMGISELYKWQHMLCPPYMRRLSFAAESCHETYIHLCSTVSALSMQTASQGCLNPKLIAARHYFAAVDLFSIHTFTELKTLCDGKGHGYVRAQYLDHLPEPYSPC